MNLAYNRLIDHTLLKPDATFEAVELLCKEAKEYHFASVCINPHFVKVAALSLKGTDVKVCTVIGFPLGQNTTETKVFETSKAILDGAQEIDMVINISQLKARHDDLVVDDIHRVKMACQGHLLKVIIETCLLNDDEKVRACKLSVSAGADFVKTSTGFSTSGATPTDVALMRKTVGPMIGVKASGGVRSFEDLLTMVKAGATRIGTSSGVKIMTAQTDSTSKY